MRGTTKKEEAERKGDGHVHTIAAVGESPSTKRVLGDDKAFSEGSTSVGDTSKPKRKNQS